VQAVQSLRGPGGPLHEKYLVAFLTPLFAEKLMSQLPEHLVLVNSEQYAWLPQSSQVRNTYTAPDQFIAPHYLVNYRSPYKDAPLIPNGQYGTFPVITSRKSLHALLDAKVELDFTGTGDFFKRMVAVSAVDSGGDAVHARGMVYDACQARLVTAICGVITSVTEVNWTDEGSRALIVDFFTAKGDAAHDAVELAKNGLQVEIPRFCTEQVNGGSLCCVLGEGAFGRVYRATRLADGTLFALNVVQGADACRGLYQEYHLIRSLPPACLDYVVGVEEGSYWTAEVPREGLLPNRVAAFLGREVGCPFQLVTEINAPEGVGILVALSGLHAAGSLHGDARWRNVVAFKLTNSVVYKWVDLRLRGIATPVGYRQDLQCFFDSVAAVASAPSEELMNHYASNVAGWNLEQRTAAARQMFTVLGKRFLFG
jgi:hypothetical protein